MDAINLTDQELETYKKIKERINLLEKKVEFYESELPSKIVKQRLECARSTLRSNTEMLYFLFGEACLRQ